MQCIVWWEKGLEFQPSNCPPVQLSNAPPPPTHTHLLCQLPLPPLVQCGDEGAARDRVTLDAAVHHVVEHINGQAPLSALRGGGGGRRGGMCLNTSMDILVIRLLLNSLDDKPLVCVYP